MRRPLDLRFYLGVGEIVVFHNLERCWLLQEFLPFCGDPDDSVVFDIFLKIAGNGSLPYYGRYHFFISSRQTSEFLDAVVMVGADLVGGPTDKNVHQIVRIKFFLQCDSCLNDSAKFFCCFHLCLRI